MGQAKRPAGLGGKVGSKYLLVPQISDPQVKAPIIRKPTDKTLPDEKRYVPLSSIQSLSDCKAEVIITHAPGTSDACETRARPVEEFIASLALRLC